ncbi:MAG: hypothetical protein SFY70_02190 [Bacteroidia bacterium]|nr:hypothetical protein [Bacteroidia bacterium]
MPDNTTPIFTRAARWAAARITAAEGTALTVVFTAGEFGSRLQALTAANADTAAQTLYLWVELPGGQSAPLHALAVPAEAGFGPAVPLASALTDALTPYIPHDAHDNRYLDLPPGALLKARVATPIAAGTSTAPNATDLGLPQGLYLTAVGQDY